MSLQATSQPVTNNNSSSLFLSVVVPTFRRTEALSKCLDLLSPSKQTLSANFYEIIVSDDATDGVSEKYVKENFPFAKWTQGPGRGPASNRNNGAKAGKGDWLVFIDDDCLPEPNLLQSYFDFISKNNEADALEGAIHPERPINKDEECPVNVNGEAFWSANVAIKTSVFKAIDGFDENYPLAALEDSDIYFRLLEKYKVVFLPEARVIHPVIKLNLSKKIKNVPRITKSWVYHALKHKKHLGFSSKSAIFWSAMKFYAINTPRELLKLNINRAIYYAYYGIIGNSLLLYYLFKFQDLSVKADLQ
jgi:GT2 family glycosyltransferase